MHSKKAILKEHRMSWAADLRILAALILVLFGSFCGRARDPVPTGVDLEELGAGRVRITATAQAEAGTIEAGNVGSMQATSCDAARLLLAHELKKSVYRNPRQNFKESPVQLIYAGEFCRRSGIYDPEGKFELPASRETTPPGR